jgi:hypothetical protein
MGIDDLSLAPLTDFVCLSAARRNGVFDLPTSI